MRKMKIVYKNRKKLYIKFFFISGLIVFILYGCYSNSCEDIPKQNKKITSEELNKLPGMKKVDGEIQWLYLTKYGDPGLPYDNPHWVYYEYLDDEDPWIPVTLRLEYVMPNEVLTQYSDIIKITGTGDLPSGKIRLSRLPEVAQLNFVKTIGKIHRFYGY